MTYIFSWKLAILRWLARSTVFASFFAITAFVLALKGKLTTEYVAMGSTVHAFIVARAVAEDYHERCGGGPQGGNDGDKS